MDHLRGFYPSSLNFFGLNYVTERWESIRSFRKTGLAHSACLVARRFACPWASHSGLSGKGFVELAGPVGSNSHLRRQKTPFIRVSSLASGSMLQPNSPMKFKADQTQPRFAAPDSGRPSAAA